MYQTPAEVAFLGFCDRSIFVREAPFWLPKHNILGLRRTVVYPLFPINIQGSKLVFAIFNVPSFAPSTLELCDPLGNRIFHSTVEFSGQPELTKALVNTDVPDSTLDVPTSLSERIANKRTEKPGTSSVQTIALREGDEWSIIVTEISVPVIINRVGIYKVYMSRGDERREIGCVSIRYLQVPPLSEELIAAIKSHPRAAKTCKYILKCQGCGDMLSIYAGLERSKEQEEKGNVWYREIPDTFSCTCGKTVVPLVMIRENLHAFLGMITSEVSKVEISKLYEGGAIEEICNNFAAVISRDPEEQEIQKFLQDNPILLHQFSPERIFRKAPILSEFETDFTIRTQSGELILIELERVGTQLLRKDGGRHSELQHAFDQVRDWLDTLETHRVAGLHCIGLKPEEVTNLKGIVIAGRDAPYDSDHLRRLKWDASDKIRLYTYDDILRSVAGLFMTVHEL